MGEKGHWLTRAKGALLGRTAGARLLGTCSACGSAAELQAETVRNKALRTRARLLGTLASRSWKRKFSLCMVGWRRCDRKVYSKGARVRCTLQFTKQIQAYSYFLSRNTWCTNLQACVNAAFPSVILVTLGLHRKGELKKATKLPSPSPRPNPQAHAPRRTHTHPHPT